MGPAPLAQRGYRVDRVGDENCSKKTLAADRACALDRRFQNRCHPSASSGWQERKWRL